MAELRHQRQNGSHRKLALVHGLRIDNRAQYIYCTLMHQRLDGRDLQRPVSEWMRLPQDDDDLAAAARDYYGADALPVAGSQAAIQWLPRVRTRSRVGVLTPSYAEHAQAWRRAGHELRALSAAQCEAAIDTLDVLVLANPNNPGGERFERDRLLDWHRRLASRGGWLVVDEAFADAHAELSVADHAHAAGLVVLRSLGKFFGLAGARVGFVLAARELREALAEGLGPWTIAGPSRQLAAWALRDRAWQRAQQQRLQVASDRLRRLLHAQGLSPDGGCALFQRCIVDDAEPIEQAFARRGILLRRFDAPSSLRFGLPASEAQWQRLQAALLARPAGLALPVLENGMSPS